jgi:hypothetical protein
MPIGAGMVTFHANESFKPVLTNLIPRFPSLLINTRFTTTHAPAHRLKTHFPLSQFLANFAAH